MSENHATFVVPPSTSGGEPRELLARLRYQSRHFRDCLIRNDMFGAHRVSADAQPVIVALFTHFRNEQDYGRIDPQIMAAPKFPIATKVSAAARDQMVSSHALTPEYATPTAGIRTALNKLAHCDPRKSTFRVQHDRHVLVPSGPEQNAAHGYWVIEVDVERLCDELEAVLNAGPAPS